MIYQVCEYGIMYTVETNLIRTEYLYSQSINLEKSIKIQEGRIRFQCGEPKSLLMIVRKDVDIRLTPEATKFFCSNKGTDLLSSIAIVFLSHNFFPLKKLLTEFKMRKVIPPICVFKNEEEAREWLLQQKTNSISMEEHRPPSLIHEYFDKLVDLYPHMLFLTDDQNRIIRTNLAACQRLGWNRNQLEGRLLSHIIKNERFLLDNRGIPVEVDFDRQPLPVGVDGRRETLWIVKERNTWHSDLNRGGHWIPDLD